MIKIRYALFIPVVLIGSAAFADPVPVPSGTPTYDASTAMGVSQVWTQTKALWNTAQEQLAQLDKMQATLIEANEGVENLQSIDLQKWAKDMSNWDLSNSKNKIGALRAQMSNFEGKLGSDANFVEFNKQNVKNLQTLDFLQQQSARNLDKSAGKTSAGMDTKITSQNTSTMAALASAEEQRKQMEDHSKETEAANRIGTFQSSGDFYKSIGKGGM